MTSTSNGLESVKIELKTEVITIDDEIQFISNTGIDDIQILEGSSNLNGICYFFEPQTSKTNDKNDQKSE